MAKAKRTNTAISSPPAAGRRRVGPGPAGPHGDVQTEQAAALGPYPGTFQEQGGEVVVEAEHFSAAVGRGGRAWVAAQDAPGYVGDAAMQVIPDTGGFVNSGFANTSPELRYTVDFATPGTYTVWLRMWGPNDNSDSVHVGLNGQAVASADRITLAVVQRLDLEHGHHRRSECDPDGGDGRPPHDQSVDAGGRGPRRPAASDEGNRRPQRRRTGREPHRGWRPPHPGADARRRRSPAD